VGGGPEGKRGGDGKGGEVEPQGMCDYVHCCTGKGNLLAIYISPSLAECTEQHRPSVPEMRKICGDRQAPSLGLRAWRGDKKEVGDVGGDERKG